MNKKLLTAATILAAATMASAIVTWNGSEGLYRVVTELDDGGDESGYWFNYADDSDGGQSAISWPTKQGNDFDESALDPIIDLCGGVCGQYTLNQGTLTYDPFVGVGFNVAGPSSVNDATSWGGVCITYTVDHTATLELGLGDAGDAAIDYANHSVSLPKAAAATTANKAWADFKQPTWAKVTEASPQSKLGSVKFKIQNKDGSTGSFNIMSIGAYNGGCRGTGAIGAINAASSVKAMLNGRTLAISGITKAATAEVMNLQGQVILKGDASSALNLSALNAGVYMVRVAGQGVDFSQKIVLK